MNIFSLYYMIMLSNPSDSLKGSSNMGERVMCNSVTCTTSDAISSV
jgi:hypothetical protein